MNPKDRIANNLVALGSAAVFTVYAAGYLRTRSAAQRFAAESAERRPTASMRQISPSNVAVTQRVDTVVPAPASTAPIKPTAAKKPKAAPTSTAAPRETTAAATTADSASPAPASSPASTPSAAPAAPVAVTPPDSATIAAKKAADSTAKAEKERAPYKDGVYFGWGTSRHGDIQAGVEIKAGRIASAFISECLTQYSCSWISQLPPQVVTRQSPEVDFVSGATQSTNAFYYAVVDALKKAK